MTAPAFPDFTPTVPELLRVVAERFGPNDCIVTPTDRLSYTELDTRSRRLAARLVERGVVKGTRLCILFPNGTTWVVAWAAAARIGALVLPVNTFFAAPELGRYLRHADAQMVIGVGAFLQHDFLDDLETVAPELLGHGPAPLLLPSLPQLRAVHLWGESTRTWAAGGLGADLDTAPSTTLVEEVVREMEADVTPGDPMVVIYTSGSTAEPKGVVHSHGGPIRHAQNLASMSQMDSTMRTWTPMPLFWVGGLIFSLLRVMITGGAFLTQEVFEPGEALRLLERERATVAGAWPGATKALRDHPDFRSTDLSSIVKGTLVDALPGTARPADPGLTINSLGMTETCGPHTFSWVHEDPTGAPEEYRGTFGHEVPGVEHRIIDPATGRDLPEGEEGEVLVRGYSLMLGIDKRERADVFDADGWYHTDDRGYFRDGWFFFTGRQSDMIKTSGSNVAPAEVEEVLASMQEIKLAFVLGVPHPDRGQDVVALVVPWAGAAPDPIDVQQRARARLSAYKVPRRIVVIADEDVPWLASMKADRRALATLAAKLAAAE